MMNQFARWCALTTVFAWCGLAAAEVNIGNPKPSSETRGNARRELNWIYRDSIGSGFTANSLSRQTLNRELGGVPNVGQMSTRPSRISTGLDRAGSASKPFGNYSPAPTVSPYLNLFREDLNGQSDLNYQTLVLPQLRQQAVNERQQRENMQMSARLQSIGAQSDFNPAGSTTQPPTGHQTVFQYYGHYYPALNQRRR